MTGAQIKKVRDAIDNNGIKVFEIISAVGSHLIHGESGFTKIDYDLGYVVNVGMAKNSGIPVSYHDNVMVKIACFDEVHEMRTAGTADQIMAFVQELGFDLSDDEKKIIIKIDSSNYEIIPENGDYINIFDYLSKAQFDALTPEEQADYLARKEAFEKAKENYIGQHAAACITYR